MKSELNYQPKQLAALLGVSVKTLDKYRRSGTGPQFVRIGRRILYRSDDVEKFLCANKFSSTAEYGNRSR